MAFSMSVKENYLACLNHKPHEFTPGPGDTAMVGMATMPFERGGPADKIDAFGVRWVSPTSAAGGALPAPGEFLLTDVTQWKKVVKIADLSTIDWENAAAMELANINRDTQALDSMNVNSIYERMAALMGFDGALLAMAEEPEASYELLSFITDWKIEMIRYLAKYYKPDTYTFFDDVATERTLFMSPETYRQLIKPLHKKIADACKEYGIIPIQHTCGKADLLVQDMIDEGCAGWSAVQATNDIEGVIQKHGHEFVLIGGYNSNGPPGYETATEEEIRAEVRRCMDEYGKYGKGYIFSGMVVTRADPNADSSAGMGGPQFGIIQDEFMKIRKESEK